MYGLFKKIYMIIRLNYRQHLFLFILFVGLGYNAAHSIG